MFNYRNYRIFKDNISTLKNTSKDDSKKSDINYMTSSELQVINFDDVKTEYTAKHKFSNECACSIDALAWKNGKLYIIEFKNGKMKDEIAKVKKKIYDTLLLFCDITQKDITYTRNNMEFILVYNGEKNPILEKEKPKKYIASRLLEKAQEELIRFQLDKFTPLFLNKVHTYTKEEFQEKWVKA